MDSRIVSSSWQNIKLWDAATGEELRTLNGHTGWVSSVSFSPDGSCIVSGGHEKTLKLWDAPSCQELRTLYGHSTRVTSVTFRLDSGRIVSRDSSGKKIVWDAHSGEPIPDDSTAAFELTNSHSPDGRWMVSAMGNEVDLVDLEYGRQPRELARRQRSARIKLHWHLDQGKLFEKEDNWFAATFHRAWIVKAKPDSADDREALRVAYQKLLEQNQANDQKLATYLPPAVREIFDQFVK